MLYVLIVSLIHILEYRESRWSPKFETCDLSDHGILDKMGLSQIHSELSQSPNSLSLNLQRFPTNALSVKVWHGKGLFLVLAHMNQFQRWEFPAVLRFSDQSDTYWDPCKYIFFCTFCWRKNIQYTCLQMSTKMSQNAPKVVHFIKYFLGGMPPDPPSICSLNRSHNSHLSLFSICCSHLCTSGWRSCLSAQSRAVRT